MWISRLPRNTSSDYNSPLFDRVASAGPNYRQISSETFREDLWESGLE